MNHVIRIKILIAVLLAAVTFAPNVQAQTGDGVCGNPLVKALIVAQSPSDAIVTISNSADQLMIDFDLSSTAWMLSEVHVHIEAPGTDPFPIHNDNPEVGKFDYKYSLAVPQNTFSLPVLLEDLGATPGDYINIAAHAVVTNGSEFETAWADWDVDWEGSHWGGYIEDYTIQYCIDIKPGTDLNTINCKNMKGVLTVAVLSTAAFDATTVDHTTVEFEDATETHTNPHTGEFLRHEKDVDGDGDIDLVFHFRLSDTSLNCGSTEAKLTGSTFGGQPIEATDSVLMIEGGGA